MTSTTLVSEACDSILGRSIGLSSLSTANQTGGTLGAIQQSTALDSLISSLGLKGCSTSVSSTIQSSNVSNGTSVSTVTSPALPLIPSPSSSSSLPSPTTFNSSSASFSSPVYRGLNKQDKIAVGVVVPIAVIASLLIILISWRRYRTRRQVRTDDNTTLCEEAQPYLQQKPELGAEEREKYEMEAQEVRHEMQGADAIYEIGPEEDTRRTSRLQELQGPEHSKELEVPDEST